MRTIAVPALALGFAASLALVVHVGYAGIVAALLAAGLAGFLGVVAIHLATIALCAGAWFTLVPASGRLPFRLLLWSRFIRDGAGEILPFSQLGGLALGLRAAVVAGMPAGRAAATLGADSAMELLSQLLFAGLAAAVFAALRPDWRIAVPIAAGLALASIAAGLWIVAQRRGLGALRRLLQAIAQRSKVPGDVTAAAIQGEIDQVYRRRPALAGAFLLHFAAWIAGAAETWVALQFMGTPLAPAPVLAIEGLIHAARGAAFAVPGALGVQEGTYVLLGAQLGLGPEAALALSLLKRARDLAIGTPALLAWQFVEGRRFLRRGPRPPSSPAAGPRGERPAAAVPTDSAQP